MNENDELENFKKKCGKKNFLIEPYLKQKLDYVLVHWDFDFIIFYCMDFILEKSWSVEKKKKKCINSIFDS